MTEAAARALAGFAEAEGLSDEHILPDMDAFGLPVTLAAAVGAKAQEQGLAARRLSQREMVDEASQRISDAREAAQRLVFAEPS